MLELPQVETQDTVEISVKAVEIIDEGVDFVYNNNYETFTEKGAFALSQVRMQEILKNEASDEIASNNNRIIDAVYNYSYKTTNENGDVIINDKRPEYKVNVDDDNAFIMYGINSEDLPVDYKETQNFAMLISQDYSLNMPVFDVKNSIISIVEMRKIRGVDRLMLSEGTSKEVRDEMMEYATKYEGQWKVSMIGMYIPLEAVEIFSNEKLLSELINSTDISEIQDVRLVTLYDYAMDIVYFSTSKEEYAIPYKYNPNFYKQMTSGKAYKIQELIDMISQEFNN